MQYSFDAAELLRRRLAAGMTQGELADDVGRTYQVIQHYETGRGLPSVTTLLRLCAALGCQPSDLLRPVLEPAS